MANIDKYGQITNGNYNTNQPTEEINKSISQVNVEGSKKIAQIGGSVNLGNTLVTVGCYAPLEVDGLKINYFDPYDSVGRQEATVANLAGAESVYIEADYESPVVLPNDSIVITQNDRRRILVTDRPLLAVLKDGEVFKDEDSLKPFREDLAKTPDQVEAEATEKRKRLRERLLSGVDSLPTSDPLANAVYVFGKKVA